MKAPPVQNVSERPRSSPKVSVQPPHRALVTPEGSQLEPKTGLTKIEAESWLDWLEAHDYRGYELVYSADKGFTVRPSGQSS